MEATVEIEPATAQHALGGRIEDTWVLAGIMPLHSGDWHEAGDVTMWEPLDQLG